MRQISIKVIKWCGFLERYKNDVDFYAESIKNLTAALSTLIYKNIELHAQDKKKGGGSKKERKHTQPKIKETFKNKFTMCLSSRRSRQML